MTTKKINILLIVIASIGSIYYCADHIINREISRGLISLAIIPVMLLPLILKKAFKLNLTPTLEFIYLIFMFFAYFLGSIADFYHTINNYDTIIHLTSGIVTSFFGLML